MQRLHRWRCVALIALAGSAACERAVGDENALAGARDQHAAVPERQIGATATAQFIDRAGRTVGEVTLEEGPEGVLIRGEITGLRPGAHGFHLHAVGRCEPPFETAAAHFNPGGRQHGFLNPAGAHAGDLPNLHADEDGTAQIEALAPKVTLRGTMNALLDDDGTALLVHASADDHRTDPSGQSGDRIACAVIR
jgi:superoxide dismutase, Cu-Zn family